jgi:NAD(P)-dependent dehydrogenase (short-subunit alcohol dehydrogenase family)
MSGPHHPVSAADQAARGSDLFGLRGRTALVTGGGKGLGLAMARALAGQGAAVCLSGRHEDVLRHACAEIARETGAPATFVVADQCERSESRRLAEAAVASLGRIDILVNNAGTNVPQAIDEITDETWDRIVELNLSSAMALSRAVTPGMKERRWGRIIVSGAERLLRHESGAHRADEGLRARRRLLRHHGQLHRAGAVPHRPAAAGILAGGDRGGEPPDGAAPVGPAGGTRGAGAAPGKRRGQLHHRLRARRRRRGARPHDVVNGFGLAAGRPLLVVSIRIV